MARLEDGEFELVLGNKQLLSSFFIVVILFGVFFTMGYIVGRNSTGGEKAKLEAEKTTAVSAGQTGEESPAPSPVPSGSKTPPSNTPPPVETPAAQSKPADVTKTPPSSTATLPSGAKAETEKPTQPVVSSTPQKTTASQAGPASGQTFLQVAAVKKPEADLLVDVLQKKKFAAQVTEVPGQDLFRVLVGPVGTQTDLAKMKASLEDAGFKPIVRKY